MKLQGKVALITGGARIGKTVAQALAREGCHICLSYRSSKKSALETKELVESNGTSSLVLKGDVSKASDVGRIIGEIIRKFKRLDVLVNMASVYFETPWEKLDEKLWNEFLDANLKSAFLTVKAASPFLKRFRGRVINVADWLCQSDRPRYLNFLPYYTSKMGVIGLTQAQALELAPHVLVNAIAPGPIVPPAKSSKSLAAEVKRVTPLRRWGGAEEIAKAVLFFCESDFVTGECLRVDGGRHLY